MLITRLWQSHCPNAQWFFLCSKDANNKWREHKFHRKELNSVSKFIQQHQDRDLYFCPHGFREVNGEVRRTKDHAVLPRLLWSDMDSCDPKAIGLKPTVAIESSPGRFVGLWLTDEVVTEEINRRLSYFLGSDVSGWDLTQVLRIPGTTNYKYSSSPRTKILWADGDEWSLSKLDKQLPKEEAGHDEASMTATEVLKKWRKRLSWRTLQLIQQKQAPAPGKRSEVLHKLFCECAEAGMQEDEAIALLSASVWNKFADRRNEQQQLQREWEKAENKRFQAKRPIAGEDEENEERVWFAKNLDEVEEEELDWVWYPYLARKQLSILQGDPEAGKSFIAQNASGHLCEGRKLPCYVKDVPTITGPVAYFDLENDAAIVTKARMRWGGYKLNGQFYQEEQPFSMADDEALGEIITALAKIKPVLVVFDTLMTYIGEGDTNNASSTMQIMARFKQMAVRLNCAVLVLRHLTKGGRDRAMYRGTGSIAISAFARIEITAGPHPTDPDVRCMARSKGNLTAPPPALCYEIVGKPTKEERDRAQFLFGGFDANVTAEHLVRAAEVPKDDGSKNEADKFLRDTLREGKVDMEKVRRMAEARNINERTLHRAAEGLKIARTHEGFGAKRKTYWSLPN